MIKIKSLTNVIMTFITFTKVVSHVPDQGTNIETVADSRRSQRRIPERDPANHINVIMA